MTARQPLEPADRHQSVSMVRPGNDLDLQVGVLGESIAISAQESLHDPWFGERAVDLVARNRWRFGGVIVWTVCTFGSGGYCAGLAGVLLGLRTAETVAAGGLLCSMFQKCAQPRIPK